MKKFLKILIYLKLFILLINCGGGWNNFKKAMSGQKTTNTDEFLIKKKDPLVLPPDFGELPLPKSNKKDTKNPSIETVLSSSGNSESETKASSELENMILKELRKSLMLSNTKIINQVFKENTVFFKNMISDIKFDSNYKNFKKFKTIIIIGMGGSILGTKAIYSFLKHKIKKKFIFIDNLDENYLNHIKRVLRKKTGCGIIYMGMNVENKNPYIVKGISGTEGRGHGGSSTLLFKPEYAVEEFSKHFEVIEGGFTSKKPWLVGNPETGENISSQFYIKFKSKEN